MLTTNAKQSTPSRDPQTRADNDCPGMAMRRLRNPRHAHTRPHKATRKKHTARRLRGAPMALLEAIQTRQRADTLRAMPASKRRRHTRKVLDTNEDKTIK